ncbi:DUF4837 family protein [Flavimarina sp. Hel_I_48]|uniref:DUF4837 family protein n=1 Tax=Flavimarina sp. Hel_I_48 TaxID=1392488 RepID=UPI0004DF8ABF|nr:DUF4837 family protein [Flavimarina sp. Hel_I_48]
MQKLPLALMLCASLISCNDKPGKRILSSSSGGLNTLTIVMPNELWQGPLGETVRAKFAGSVEGLPQVEPLFDINQMPIEAFKGFMRKQRTFLKIEKSDTLDLSILNNPYAKPQTGIVVKGPDINSIIGLIAKDSATIVETFKNTERKEKLRRVNLAPQEDDMLRKNFGISMKFPDAYRYAETKNDFFWIRKDVPNGDMDITVYEVPFSMIDKDTNTIAAIIKMRDSISGDNILTDEGTRFRTEPAYAPYLKKTTIDGKPAWETKGTWDVKGRFMAGPFVNYAIKDEKNKRYLILEGFVFKPSSNKRDNMFELESILRSVRFIDEK